MSNQEIPSILDDVIQQFNTNYMGIASFTMLVWDHIDTFADEVEFIWNGRKSLLVYLFFLNRYLTPLGFIVNLFAYLSPVWTPEVCSRFIRFEGSMTLIGINVVGLMMLIRIHALYHKNEWVVRGVAFILLVQFCMNSWLLTRGEAVVHNPNSGIRSCTMIFDPEISILASSSAWLPLLYDTVVLGLTLNRTFPSNKRKSATYVMTRLLEDGLIYYTAIFAVTAVLTIMIIAAPPGLKNITAQLELLLTVAMMSRITINLKRSVRKVCTTDKIVVQFPSMFTRATHHSVEQGIQIRAPGFNESVYSESSVFIGTLPGTRSGSPERGVPGETEMEMV